MSKQKRKLYRAKGEVIHEVIFYVCAKDRIEAKVKIEKGEYLDKTHDLDDLGYTVTGKVEEDT